MTGQEVFAPDVQADERWKYKDWARKLGWRSVLCVPVKVHERVIGVLSMYETVVRKFSEMERRLIGAYTSQIA